MKVLLGPNDPPQASERSFNGLRVALARAARRAAEVRRGFTF